MKPNTTITNTINKHFNKVVYSLSIIAIVAFWTVASLMFTSCQKEPQPTPTGKEITVQVNTQGLFEAPMTKSFDLSQWQYVYNSQQYELKFQSATKTYTFNKSIAELRQGFAISVLPDNYVITYTTLHAPESPLNDYLDIIINESKSITTPTDLTLQAKNDDYLVIADNECVEAGFNYMANWYYLYAAPNSQTFKYGYMNQEGKVIINCKYIDYANNNNISYTEITIPNAQKGNVYHIVNSVNGNTGINIEGMTYNLIGN